MAPWGWCAPDKWRTVVALYYVCLLLSPAFAAPPQFDANPFIATLNEKTGQTTTLLALPCTDPDNDPVSVTLPTGGVSPQCGNCFSVVPCVLPLTGAGYCLVYYPGGGTLSQTNTPKFFVNVRCSDATDSVSKTVQVILTRNSPPTFDPNQFVASKTVTNTKSRNAGYVIYDVNAADRDNDGIIYTMTTSPASDNFDIGAGDGIIRAKNSLMSECNDAITFYVTINDGINSPVGPLAVHTTLVGSNQRPEMTNLDVDLLVPEDRGKVVLTTIQASDDDGAKKLTYTYTANPPANQALYGIIGDEIKVAAALDYETVSQRFTEMTVVASDGFCTSTSRKVRLTLTDVNEPPDINPKDTAYSVYEGPDFGPNFRINWNIVDEDFADTHTFEIFGGNNKKFFTIDPNTGQLMVNGDYDIDDKTNPTTVNLRIQVTDKGGLKSKTTVILNFKDRNDKYPKIMEGKFGFTVCEDKRVGATLEPSLNCTDDDLTSPNNDVYITGGGNGITVLSGGSILLTNPPALGQTIRTTASCSDRGQFPGPLTSVTPVPITVTTIACPTLPPSPNTRTPNPATQTPATPAAPVTGNGTASGAAADVSWVDENLWWIILAGLLAMPLLALLLYMLLTYCRPYCLQCLRGIRCCRSRPPAKPRVQRYKPKAVTPRAVTPRDITPVEKPREPIPPPAILPEPYLHDFWKERYPDDDYGNQPDRTARPRPVTPENGFAQAAGNGNGSGTGNNPAEKPGGLSVPLKKKSRFCNIL